MKRKYTSLLLALPALLLASCAGTSSTSAPSTSTSSSTTSSGADSTTIPDIDDGEAPEEFVTAIKSLRKNSHQVHINSLVQVLHPDPYAVDLQIVTDQTIVQSYKTLEDGTIERGYHVEGSKTNSDLNKDEGHTVNESTTTVYPIADQTIFEDPATGVAYDETLTIDNTVVKSMPANQDETGVYDPLIFADQFKNPWDYIDASDLSYGTDGNIHLDITKAAFLMEAYELNSVNKPSDCIVNLNSNNQIASVTFAIDDIGSETYTRHSTLSLTYSGFGTATVEHLAPLTNENPELETAFANLTSADSFTYTKVIKNLTNNTVEKTTAYYVKDANLVYFHQGDEDRMYTNGNNYDYVASYQESGTYAGQWMGYNYVQGTTGWDWGIVYVTGTYPYLVESWDALIPQVKKVSTALFHKDEDGAYVCDDRLDGSIGSYFDNGFLAVNSEALETSGTGLKLTLKDGNIDTIETGFTVSNQESEVTFTLSDINSTTLPDFFLESWGK